tara:strand:- start:5 stop:370 length:366 start_codon:yes stop_codon:yes gene_type:complete
MSTLEACRDALLDAGQDPIGALTVQPSIGDRLLDLLGGPCYQVGHQLIDAVAGQVGDAGATPQGLTQLLTIHFQELGYPSTEDGAITSRWSSTLRTHVVALAHVQPGLHLAGSLVGVLARL